MSTASVCLCVCVSACLRGPRVHLTTTTARRALDCAAAAGCATAHRHHNGPTELLPFDSPYGWSIVHGPQKGAKGRAHKVRDYLLPTRPGGGQDHLDRPGYPFLETRISEFHRKGKQCSGHGMAAPSLASPTRCFCFYFLFQRHRRSPVEGHITAESRRPCEVARRPQARTWSASSDRPPIVWGPLLMAKSILM